MINIVQNGSVYEISFPYDPAIVDHIRNIPGRKWLPDRKVWTIPKDKLGWVANELKGTKYESIVVIKSDEFLWQNETLDATFNIPDIDISKIPFAVKKGSKPYQHQLDFMKFAIDRQQHGVMSGFLVADDPGLGKTLEAMNLALYNRKQHGFKHCLIICCVNSSKYNWKNDIFEHTQGKEDPYILGVRRRRDGTLRYDTGSKEKYEDIYTGHMYGDKSAPKLPYFIVMNIEAIRYKVGKVYPIADALVKWTALGKLQMVVIDEIHKNCSPSSMQGKQLIRFKRLTGSKIEWLPMTGTPITKKPTDVFLPLKLTDTHSYNSFYAWCNEFVVYGGFGGHEVVGYKNIPRLKAMLQNNMIRRLKSEVLDLPEKVRITEYVENSEYQHTLYTKVLQDIVSHKENILTAFNPMARFLRLRQINGSPELVDLDLKVDSTYLKKNAKLTWLLDKIDEIVDRGEKVIVFSNWVEPLRTLYSFVSKKYKTCTFTGTMTEADREKHKRVFQTNPEYKVLLGTIGAGGTTHTFTAASNVIFYDEPWNPSDREQAEDRAHRIGMGDHLNIYTVITRNTVDDRVHQILSTKEGISTYIVDNGLDIRNNPALFDLLLGHDAKLNKLKR